MNIAFFKSRKGLQLNQSIDSYRFRDLRILHNVKADIWFSKNRLINFIKGIK